MRITSLRQGPARIFLSFAAVAVFVSSSFSATAQATYYYDYPGTINGKSKIESLDDGLFGDEVSYIEGGIGFRVVDVVASTSVKLPLQFGRRMDPFADNLDSLNTQDREADKKILILGPRWKPDIPSIVGVYPTRDGLYTGAKPRCSGGTLSPLAISIPSSPPVLPYNFWYGMTANIPGHGKEKIWPLTPGSVVPADNITYKFSTVSNWRVSCLPSLKNGPGEGYVIALPDGSRYFFDWLALRNVSSFSTSLATEARKEMYFLATKAVDRYGNSVTYEYDPVNPTHLTRMLASDGAEIRLTYGANGKLAEVVSGGRTWRYSYATMGGREELQYVTLPDSSKWQYTIPEYAYGNQLSNFGRNCDFRAYNLTSSGDSSVFKQTMVHPSGAVGEFVYKWIAHGYNNVHVGSCLEHQPLTTLVGRVKAYALMSLVSKTIKGPGLADRTWSITYAPSWTYASECANGCASTSQTIVTSGDGKVETYIFGNDFQRNPNQLLSHAVSKAGVVLRKSEYRYVASMEGQPFPDYIAGPTGEALSDTLDNPFFRRNRPRTETAILQGGTLFKSTVNAFDTKARPVNVTESSAPLP